MDGLLGYASPSPSSGSSTGSSTSGSSSDASAGGAKRRRTRASSHQEQQPQAEGEWQPPALQQGPSGLFNDPAHHQGRARRFPHVEGQYPTTVYIPVELDPEQAQAIDRLVTALQGLVPTLHPLLPHRTPAAASNGDAPAEAAATAPGAAGPAATNGGAGAQWAAPGSEALGWHVSLSRCLPVRYAARETLMIGLKDELQRRLQDASFHVALEGVCFFVNDDASRTFVSLPVTAGKAKVCEAIRAVDAAFACHSLQTFYEDPRPHISVAWALGSCVPELEAALQGLQPSGGGGGGGAPAADGSGASGSSLAQLAALRIQHSVSRVLCRFGKHDELLWSAAGSAAERGNGGPAARRALR